MRGHNDRFSREAVALQLSIADEYVSLPVAVSVSAVMNAACLETVTKMAMRLLSFCLFLPPFAISL